MGRLIVVWMLGVGTPATPPGKAALDRFEFSQTEMAVPVRIVLYAPDKHVATKAAKEAYGRIHQLNTILSDYDPKSELRRLCDTSREGVAVSVSEDLWRVLSYGQALAQRSDGAFDVTVGPVVRLWRRARRQHQLPSAEQLASARALVGYRLVRLAPSTHAVELLRPGMRLDVGGIGKGYAVEEALAVLKRSGISRALVDAGGDIALGDPPPRQPGWRIAVARLQAGDSPGRRLLLSRVAIATSGDTWQYVEIGGRRYGHIVDPRTGLGLTDHSSVTVVAPDGMTADGLASAVSVLGPEKGIQLIKDTPGTEALIVRAPQGQTEVYESPGWNRLPVADEELSGWEGAVP